MEVTVATWIVSCVGLLLIALLGSLQLVALFRPRAEWTVKNVYGGEPTSGNADAYFAFNRGYAWADVVFLAPLQIVASIGMLLGQPWGFVVGLIASTPFWYSAINFFVWDRALGIQKPSATYWVLTWGMWPFFGVVEAIYCASRLLA